MTKRMRFFRGHLGVSLVIALIIATLAFGIWYPSPLAKATGMTKIILMMFVIDVIVGPILGLIVYKEHKKSLKFDLAVVIILQLMAMSYGVYSLAEGRPAWIVSNGSRFELVRNNEIIIQDTAKVKDAYQQPSWTGPKFVAIQYSQDPKVHGQQVFEEVMGGISLAQRPDMYQPVESINPTIVKTAKPLEILNQYNDENKVKSTLAKFPKANGFLPLKAGSEDMTVLIDKKNGGQVVGIVDLRPWSVK